MSVQEGFGYTGMIDPAPRWTWRLVLVAMALSIAFLLILPMMEALAQNARPNKTVRSVTPLAVMPEPVAPLPLEPLESSRAPRERSAEVMPTLPEPLPQMPLHAMLDLKLAPGLGGFRFSLAPAVASAPTLGSGTGVFTLADLDSAPKAVNRLRPVYPASARARGIEGIVEVEFTVNGEGRAVDVRVVSADHGDLFVSATIRAIRQWRFAPGQLEGRAVPVRMLQRITYQLETP